MNPIEWFYAKGDKHSGPVNSNELRRMATAGELKPDDLVWREGMADWTIARNVRGLFEEENKAATAAAGQNAAAPPKLVEPVAMPTAPAATGIPTPAASAIPQRPKTVSNGKHLFDILLNLVRAQFPAEFVESTTRRFVALGKFGIWAAMGLLVLVSLLMTWKDSPFPTEFVSKAAVSVIVLFVLQYIAVRFCNTMENLTRSTRTTFTSVAFLDCFALLSMALGVGSLVGSLIMAKSYGYELIFYGLASFVIHQYLAFIALNPQLISVQIVPESTIGEDALGLLWLLLKATTRLSSVVFGSVAVLGSLMLVYAAVLMFSKDGPAHGGATAVTAADWILYASSLPFVAYLVFLLIGLSLDICRAILVIPSKLDKSQNQEVK